MSSNLPVLRAAKQTLKALKRSFVDRDPLISRLESERALWQDLRTRAAGHSVLIASSMACYNHAAVVERALAVALTARGAKVDFLLCDRALPSCQMTKIDNAPPDRLLALDDTPRCDDCMSDLRHLFVPMGLDVRTFGQYLSPERRRQAWALANEIPASAIRSYVEGGMSIGEHAYAGALRYFAAGSLAGQERGEGILRRFFHSALLAAAAMRGLLSDQAYDVVVFHHGIYTPQGIVGEVCRAQGIRVVNWNPSYRSGTFIFSHGDSYHRTMISEPVSHWVGLKWSSGLERLTMSYLSSRRSGSQDWIWFHEKDKQVTHEEVGAGLDIDWSRPCIGLLTNVMWDAQLHYRGNAFPDMLAWLEHTVRHFAAKPDLQLIVRIHPAEISGLVPSRQRVADELKLRFPELPPNVVVVPPEHPASTYALMEKCDSVLIFNTKTGIELTCLGIPVIVAGEAWIRGKGFSIDAASAEEYEGILGRLPLGRRLSESQVELAKRYAFHFFFRRMLELPFIRSPSRFVFSIEIESILELGVGRHPGLDVVCNGILRGDPFVDRYESRAASTLAV